MVCCSAGHFQPENMRCLPLSSIIVKSRKEGRLLQMRSLPPAALASNSFSPEVICAAGFMLVQRFNSSKDHLEFSLLSTGEDFLTFCIFHLLASFRHETQVSWDSLGLKEGRQLKLHPEENCAVVVENNRLI